MACACCEGECGSVNLYACCYRAKDDVDACVLELLGKWWIDEETANDFPRRQDAGECNYNLHYPPLDRYYCQLVDDGIVYRLADYNEASLQPCGTWQPNPTIEFCTDYVDYDPNDSPPP